MYYIHMKKQFEVKLVNPENGCRSTSKQRKRYDIFAYLYLIYNRLKNFIIYEQIYILRKYDDQTKEIKS